MHSSVNLMKALQDATSLILDNQIEMQSIKVKLCQQVINDLTREGDLTEVPAWVKTTSNAQRILTEMQTAKTKLFTENKTRNIAEL